MFARVWLSLLCGWAPVCVALDLEARFSMGRSETVITVLGTSDFARIQPVFSGFIATHGVAVEYLQASSRSIDDAVREGLPDTVDLVMSSAVDLQVKLVNDGFAQRIALESVTARHWREQLVQVAIEPIVTVYHARIREALAEVRTRADLVRLLEQAQGQAQPWQVAIYDPRESGVGYLLSQQDAQQDSRFWQLLEAFHAGRLWESCCSGDMIDAVIGGEIALAYNVIESYVLTRMEHAPELQILRFDDYQLAIPRTAFVPVTADQPDWGAALVRYFVSDLGQSGLSPVIRLSILDADQGRGGPLKPIRLSPALIVHLDPMVKEAFFKRWQASAP